MANQPTGVWGLDVGQCALKALRLEMIDGQVTATAFDYVEHPKILSQPDADPDQLTREALEKFLSRNTLKGDLVAISVPGQSGLARFVKLPPVEEKKINDIVRFEAKQQIPFPLDEVIWDYQRIGSGMVTDGFAMETEIGLFAMKRDMINRMLQHFKDVDIEVHIAQMAPLALCNFVAYDLLKKDSGQSEPAEKAAGEASESEEEEAQGKKRCVVALDIGTDNSNLVITDGERVIWQRPIPHGGNHFTRALTKDLKLTFAKAEHLKRNATKSPDLKKILSALKPVLNDFVGEVQRSLGYFTNTHRDARVVYMVGLGNAFRLPGLQKFLSEKLQLEVRKLQKLERLSGDSVLTAPAFTQNLFSFPVAYGLALQGLGLTRLHTNLLPQEIRIERLVRDKKPWAVTAAAALLAGATALTAGYALAYRAVAADPVVNAMKEGETVVKKAADYGSQFDSKKKAIEDNENNIRSIMAGQEERRNWLMLERYINDCLPVPAVRIEGKIKGPAPSKTDEWLITDRDGVDQPFPAGKNDLIGVLITDEKTKQQTLAKSLQPGTEATVIFQADPGAKKYWNEESFQAYLKLYERQAAGKSGERAEADDEGVQNLIQINLEAVQARYLRDLKMYYDAVKSDEDGRKWEGTPEKEAKEPPEGPGWVVEVRGYTYKKRDAHKFLLDTLVHNLATRAAKKDDDKSAGDKAPADKPGGDAAKPAADANAKIDDKLDDKQKLWKQIIEGRISHVVLFRYDQLPAGDLNFQIIGSSALPSAMGGGGGLAGPGGMMPSMGMMKRMAAGERGMEPGGGDDRPASGASGGGFASSWQSLLDSAGGDSGPGMPGRGMAGMLGGGDRREIAGAGEPRTVARGMYGEMMKKGRFGGIGGIPGAPSTPADTPESKSTTGKQAMRTEFVILFVWKEPTPTDDRMGEPEATSEDQGGGMLPGSMPMGPGGVPMGPMGPGGVPMGPGGVPNRGGS